MIRFVCRFRLQSICNYVSWKLLIPVDGGVGEITS